MSRLDEDLARYYDQEAASRAERELDPDRVLRRSQFIELMATEGRRSVLEVGIGPGRDAAAFLAAGIATSGVDLSAEHVRIARSIGADAHVASVRSMPFAARSFCAGWTMSTLLHIPNDELDEALSALCATLMVGAPLAIGLWGGRDVEEVRQGDEIEPKRFFSRRSDARLRQFLEPYGEIERFDTWQPMTDFSYQYVIMRVR